MAVQERVGMPLDEFIRQTSEEMFELINGETIPRLPNVAGHTFVMHLLYELIFAHITMNSLGKCFMEATYILPHQDDSNWVAGSRIPDVMFITADRWSAYIKSNPDWKQKPFIIVPDLIIEVVSPTDRVSQLDEKVDAYLADGVRLIVVIDPQRKKATISAPDMEQPLHLSGDSQIDLGDVIPDFQITLASLFE